MAASAETRSSWNRRRRPKAPDAIDPYALPAKADGVHDDTGATVDVGKAVDVNTVEAEAKGVDPDGDDLPVIQTRDALDALDKVLIANADAETFAFLLDSAKAKLWRHAYVEPDAAKTQATGFKGDTYSSIVRDRFLAEYTEAEALELPAGYSFRPGGLLSYAASASGSSRAARPRSRC